MTNRPATSIIMICMFILSSCHLVILSPHPCLKTDHSTFARQQAAGDLPAENARAGLIVLHRKDGGAIGLGTAGNVLQPPGQTVGNDHAGNRLTAALGEWQREG